MDGPSGAVRDQTGGAQRVTNPPTPGTVTFHTGTRAGTVLATDPTGAVPPGPPR